MKIYQASSFARAYEMNNNMIKLEAYGHIVVSRWHSSDQIDKPDLQLDVNRLSPDNRYTVEWALNNFQDIDAADTLLFYSSMADGVPKGQGGRHTEFGYAWHARKTIFFIGKREVIFHALVPDSQVFETIDEFIEMYRDYE